MGKIVPINLMNFWVGGDFFNGQVYYFQKIQKTTDLLYLAPCASGQFGPEKRPHLKFDFKGGQFSDPNCEE